MLGIGIRPGLEVGSMANYVRLELDPSSKLKARAQLRLKKWGLFHLYSAGPRRTWQKKTEALNQKKEYLNENRKRKDAFL